MARIRSETLRELIRRAMGTRPEEIGCETCYAELDQFVEIELAGKNAAQAMPLVKRHLELCAGCNDEYSALLTALNQMDSGEQLT